MHITIMYPETRSVTTYDWDVSAASDEEIKVLIEALGYNPDKVHYMVADEEPFVGSSEVSDILPNFRIRKEISESDIKMLRQASDSASDIIEFALFNFVKSHGNAPTEYDLNEFGLDFEADEGNTITKVLNIFDNGGAYFSVQISPNESFDGSGAGQFEHYAFQCLYIIESNGSEQLKYYAFANDGIRWELDAEPYHGKVSSLRLDVIENLRKAIAQEFSNQLQDNGIHKRQ